MSDPTQLANTYSGLTCNDADQLITSEAAVVGLNIGIPRTASGITGAVYNGEITNFSGRVGQTESAHMVCQDTAFDPYVGPIIYKTGLPETPIGRLLCDSKNPRTQWGADPQGRPIPLTAAGLIPCYRGYSPQKPTTPIPIAVSNIGTTTATLTFLKSTVPAPETVNTYYETVNCQETEMPWESVSDDVAEGELGGMLPSSHNLVTIRAKADGGQMSDRSYPQIIGTIAYPPNLISAEGGQRKITVTFWENEISGDIEVEKWYVNVYGPTSILGFEVTPEGEYPFTAEVPVTSESDFDVDLSVNMYCNNGVGNSAVSNSFTVRVTGGGEVPDAPVLNSLALTSSTGGTLRAIFTIPDSELPITSYVAYVNESRTIITTSAYAPGQLQADIPVVGGFNFEVGIAAVSSAGEGDQSNLRNVDNPYPAVTIYTASSAQNQITFQFSVPQGDLPATWQAHGQWSSTEETWSFTPTMENPSVYTATVDATTFSGKTINLTVRSNNAGGYSAYSNIYSVEVRPNAKPNPPSLLRTEAYGAGYTSLRYYITKPVPTPVPAVTAYTAYLTWPGQVTPVPRALTIQSQTAAGVVAGLSGLYGSYEYQTTVTATNAIGESDQSNVVDGYIGYEPLTLDPFTFAGGDETATITAHFSRPVGDLEIIEYYLKQGTTTIFTIPAANVHRDGDKMVSDPIPAAAYAGQTLTLTISLLSSDGRGSDWQNALSNAVSVNVPSRTVVNLTGVKTIGTVGTVAPSSSVAVSATSVQAYGEVNDVTVVVTDVVETPYLIRCYNGLTGARMMIQKVGEADSYEIMANGVVYPLTTSQYRSDPYLLAASIGGLAADIQYEAKIRAVLGGQQSEWSPTFYFGTGSFYQGKPFAPSINYCQFRSWDPIELTAVHRVGWTLGYNNLFDNPNNGSNYLLYNSDWSVELRMNDSGDWVEVARVSGGTFYADITITDTVMYRDTIALRVRAINGTYGNGAYSYPARTLVGDYNLFDLGATDITSEAGIAYKYNYFFEECEVTASSLATYGFSLSGALVIAGGGGGAGLIGDTVGGSGGGGQEAQTLTTIGISNGQKLYVEVGLGCAANSYQDAYAGTSSFSSLKAIPGGSTYTAAQAKPSTSEFTVQADWWNCSIFKAPYSKQAGGRRNDPNASATQKSGVLFGQGGQGNKTSIGLPVNAANAGNGASGLVAFKMRANPLPPGTVWIGNYRAVELSIQVSNINTQRFPYEGGYEWQVRIYKNGIPDTTTWSINCGGPYSSIFVTSYPRAGDLVKVAVWPIGWPGIIMWSNEITWEH